MKLVKTYDIRRIKKDLYVVTCNGESVADFTTYKQAEDFLFIRSADDLAKDYGELEVKMAA